MRKWMNSLSAARSTKLQMLSGRLWSLATTTCSASTMATFSIQVRCCTESLRMRRKRSPSTVSGLEDASNRGFFSSAYRVEPSGDSAIPS